GPRPIATARQLVDSRRWVAMHVAAALAEGKEHLEAGEHVVRFARRVGKLVLPLENVTGLQTIDRVLSPLHTDPLNLAPVLSLGRLLQLLELRGSEVLGHERMPCPRGRLRSTWLQQLKRSLI